MDKKYYPLAAIIALVVVGLIAWAIADDARSPEPLPGPKDSTEAYRNDAHGFEISSYKELIPENSFQKYYVLSDKWRAEAPEGEPGEPVVAIPVFRIDNNQDGVATGKPYPLYFTAEVRVGVSSDPQAVTDCLKPDPGYTDQKQETVVLNGTEFERFEFGSAAMMQYVQGVSYRTVKDGKCFAVEQLKAGSSYRDDSMEPGVPDSQLDVYYSQAGEIAETFRFTR